MIQLKHKVSFTDRCKRDNNEDFAGSNRNQEFVVCDGVGGRQKGEIASEIVAKTFLKAYQLPQRNQISPILSEKTRTQWVWQRPSPI
jgi:serine/threonine protein phosphatase PrpC